MLYMLAIIDRFSRWVKAVPSKDQSAATVIKFLTREVMPRFVIPSEISSDNGAVFIQKTLKQVTFASQIKTRLRLSSSTTRYDGKSEWDAQDKICASTKLIWIDALPLTIMSY